MIIKLMGFKNDDNTNFIINWLNKFSINEVEVYFANHIGYGLFKSKELNIQLPSDQLPMIWDNERDIARCGTDCFYWLWFYSQSNEFKKAYDSEVIEKSRQFIKAHLDKIEFIKPNEISELYSKYETNIQKKLPEKSNENLTPSIESKRNLLRSASLTKNNVRARAMEPEILCKKAILEEQ
jgi:hypothetical protein